MLSPQLRNKVHNLWTLVWSAGMTNPLVAIEQITYLLFLRQLEGLDARRVKDGKLTIYYPGERKDRTEVEHTRAVQAIDELFRHLDSRSAVPTIPTRSLRSPRGLCRVLRCAADLCPLGSCLACNP